MTHEEFELQQKVVHWIFRNLKIRSSGRPNTVCTNYGLKHHAENDIGAYVSPDMMHRAMIEAGYQSKPVPDSPNFWYNIASDSPLFKR